MNRFFNRNKAAFADEQIYMIQEGPFPDRPWQKDIFPEKPTELPAFRDPSLSRDVFGIPNAAGGYVFHDGFIYYLDRNWVLCSRPLLGKGEEGAVRYEGTGIAVDAKGHPPAGMSRLYFGETKFYYQYVAEIYETADTQELEYTAPRVKEMGEYIGELPKEGK